MTNAFFTRYIQLWAKFFRYLDTPEHEIPAVLRHFFRVSNCIVNGMMAGMGGYFISLYLQGDAFVALKLSACMTATGYHLQVFPGLNITKRITTTVL